MADCTSGWQRQALGQAANDLANRSRLSVKNHQRFESHLESGICEHRHTQVRPARLRQRSRKAGSSRAMLNFGHTFGHAIETANQYKSTLTHGEAISIGMITALKISVKLKKLKKDEMEDIINHFNKVGLPTKYKKNYEINLITSGSTKLNINNKQLRYTFCKINNNIPINFIKRGFKEFFYSWKIMREAYNKNSDCLIVTIPNVLRHTMTYR